MHFDFLQILVLPINYGLASVHKERYDEYLIVRLLKKIIFESFLKFVLVNDFLSFVLI